MKGNRDGTSLFRPSPSVLTDQGARVRAALLTWFARHARPLPWRKTRNPYAVWVSEVMLQQTQVATVVSYYRRFLRTFPTIERLAEAPIERVLEVWSGLGYYRRARCLHQAAQFLVQECGGRFPRDYGEARALPGVGDYTARAVLSLAYNLPFTVLDGNAARVVARLGTYHGGLHQRRFRRAVERELKGLLPRRRPGDFNQALMELGQTVCLPRSPRCSVCPLGRWCRGYHLGRPEDYPTPRPRRAHESRYLAVAVIRRGPSAAPSLALVRGLDEGLTEGLWNLPAAFGSSGARALGRLREKLAAIGAPSAQLGEPFAELRHGITYRAIRVQLYRARVRKLQGDLLHWMPLDLVSRAAVSQLTRKIAAELERERMKRPRFPAGAHRSGSSGWSANSSGGDGGDGGPRGLGKGGNGVKRRRRPELSRLEYP